MFSEILTILLETVAALFGIALLLRAYMNYVGLPARNPAAQFVLALTDWLVRPLRRVLPAAGRIDVASLLGAYIFAVIAVLVIQFVVRDAVAWDAALIGGLIRVVRWALLSVLWLTILYALLSWINPHAPMAPAIELLVRPFLAPFRRIIPLVGGVDLSPMALGLTVYILLMVMDRVR
jgi:YggT family protein